MDASIFCSFKVSERGNLWFRAAVFNLTNGPRFVAPVADVGNTRFMEITNAQGTDGGGIEIEGFRFGLRFGTGPDSSAQRV